MSASTLTVPEMSCEACRTTIEGALGRLAGVHSVNVDLERKLVSIEHDAGRTPVSQLVAAVEDEGYEVTDSEGRQ